jgi:hypothetical protein
MALFADVALGPRIISAGKLASHGTCHGRSGGATSRLEFGQTQPCRNCGGSSSKLSFDKISFADPHPDLLIREMDPDPSVINQTQ